MPTLVTLNVGSAATGRDHATLAAAWAAIPADLVAADVAYDVLLHNDSEFVVGAALVMSGKTTSAACNIRIRPAPGKGYADNPNVLTNELRYNPANGVAYRYTSNVGIALHINNNYVSLEGLQLYVKGANTSSPWGIVGNVGLTGSNIERCLVELAHETSVARGINTDGVPVRSCIVISSSVRADNYLFNGASGVLFENCTAVRLSTLTAGTGARGAFNAATSGNVRLVNCAAFNVPLLTDNGSYATVINCASDTAIAKGTGHKQNLVYADQFVNTASDFRLKAGSALIDAGAAEITHARAISGPRVQGSAPDIGAWEYAAAATKLNMAGPTVANIGYPVHYTVTANGMVASNTTVTPTATGGGTWSPTSGVITPAGNSLEFTYTPASSGTKAISATSNPALTAADPISLEVTQRAPTGTITKQPAPDGQSLSVSFSTLDNPTSATASLNPDPANPNGASGTSGAVTLTSGGGTATFSGIPPGNYLAPEIALTNAGGTATVTGGTPVTILAITGEPEAPEAPTDTTAPTITAAIVASASPGVVVLTSSEPLDTNSVPAASAFTVSGHTVQSVAIQGSAINLTVTPAFANGEAPRTVSYTVPGTNPVRDLASPANPMAAFSGVAITNNVAAPVSTVTGVTINPTSATVAGGATQAFTATAQGTNNPAQTFNFTRNPAVGAITGNGTATGSFTAPAATNVPQVIEVTATSTQDPNYSAKAVVTVPAAAPAGTNFTRSIARTIKVKPAPQMFEGGPFWNTTNKTRPVGTIDKDETIDVSFDLTEVLADISDTVKQIDFDLDGLTSVGGYFTGAVATVFVSNAVARAGGRNPAITCKMTTNSTPARVEDWTVELRIEEQ